MYLLKKDTSRSRGSSIVVSLIREVGIDDLVGEFVDVLILMVLQVLYAVETYN